MTAELFWLTATITLTAVIWVPYIIDRILEYGLITALCNPKPDQAPKAKWAKRLMQAHSNAVENLVIFAPLVLILNVLNISTQLTVLAASMYFWSRVAHAIIYVTGLPYLRTIAFFISVIAQFILIHAIFSA